MINAMKTMVIVLSASLFFLPLNASGGCGCSARKAEDAVEKKKEMMIRSKCSEGNCINGKGVMTMEDGTKYEGSFKSGLPDGEGIFTHPVMPRSADGIYDYSRVETYKGQVQAGLKQGNGIFTFSEGSKYVGAFDKDKMNGKGTISNTDGLVYEGTFENGRPQGEGTVTFPDGKKYVGQVSRNFMQGQGTMTFPDGKKYVGEFQMNKIQGQGIMTYPDGRKEEGQFENDKFVGNSTAKADGSKM